MSFMYSPKNLGNIESSSFNSTVAKDHAHSTLKKFLADLKSRDFDSIKYATYRTAAKLFYIQRSTNLHLVDLYNVIESFRENGLNTAHHNTDIDESRLECVIASIFFALFKRLPSSNDIDVESNIVSLTQWLMHAYDRSNVGRIRIFSIKTALTALCSGRLVDKMRYVFTQISESNGLLNISQFGNYLKELLLLPAAVGEEPNFAYGDETLKGFCRPIGALDENNTKLDQFLQSFMVEKTSGVLFWLHMLHKLIKSSPVEHSIQCKACGRKPFSGLRYKCLDCNSYQLCQDCFWRERVSGSHTNAHDMREYSTGNRGEKGTSVKKKLLCSPSRRDYKLPDYPKDPEPSKTLDMSNIVPAIPADLMSPVSPGSQLFDTLTSPNGTLCFNIFQEESSKVISQESITRMDDEHRLIVRYSQRLASEITLDSGSSIVDSSFEGEISKEQRAMITSLEDQNRSLLLEIRKLKVEHDQTVKNAQQVGTDPNVLTELKVLRQRKDELEMRMSALQETRRELMVQLEGLMKLLKNNQSSPRGIQRNPSIREITQSCKVSQTSGQGQPPQGTLSGVNGDVKQAFGKSNHDEIIRNLRVDLFHTVDDITAAVSILVDELSKDEGEEPLDTTTGSSGRSSSKKYEQLTHDLDLIMNELSATQANQDVIDLRNPVISY